MANDKKFIVKNGLLTQENVVIGSLTDNGVDRLQITGSSSFQGTLTATQSTSATATVEFTNDGGPSALIAKFIGDSSSLDITNFTAGDYVITNSGNGIRFYNTTDGLEIVYNNSVDLEFSVNGIDFKREPTYNGFVFWNAGNDGANSGLDADLLDGLESTQFLRSDQDDTMNGSLTINGDLTVSGNTTYINTEEILLSDNIITLNANYTGSTPTENAGIEVERGTLPNPKLVWNETGDYWQLEAGGVVVGRIITTADEGSGNGFDADTVDGLEAEQFLRSDVDDTAAGNITIQGDLTVGDGNGTANIRMDGAGTNGTISSQNGEIGFLGPSFNFAIKVKTDGDIEVRDDIFAERFIDKDATTYFAHPGDNSVFHALGLDDDLFHNGDTDTKLRFDTDLIQLNTGGGTRLTIANDNVAATVEVRAPRFVDSDNNAYLVDPNGTSVLNTIGIDSDLFHNGDTDTKISFATNDISFQTGGAERFGLDDDSADFTVNVYAPRYYDSDDTSFFGDFSGTSVLNTIDLDGSIRRNGDVDTLINFPANNEIGFETGGTQRLLISDASAAFSGLVTAKDLDVYSGNVAGGEANIGIAANQRFNFEVTDEQGYIRYYQDEVGSTPNHSVNFEIQSSSTYPHKFTFNKDVALGANNVEAGNGIFSTAVYAPKYWDADDVTHYGDFGNSAISLYFAGQSQGGNGTSALPTYSFKSDPNTGMFRGTTDRLDFSAGGNVELQIHTTYASAPGSFRAPIFYDLDNTAFYGDFAGTSVVNNIDLDGAIRHNGDTDTYINFPAADTFAVVTGGTGRLSVTNAAITGTVDMVAPRFVDSNNNAYYADPASTSVMSRIDIDDYIRHNGDADTYIGFAVNDTFRVFTGGTQRLNIDNDSADFAQNVFAPQYYTNDYLIHNGDTDTYIGFNANDTFGVWTAGVNRLSIAAAASTFTNKLIIPDYIEHAGDTNTYIGFDANDNFGVWTAGTKRVEVDSTGQIGFGGTPGVFFDINKPTAVGNNPFVAGNVLFRLGDAGTPDYSIRTDASGNIYQFNESNGNYVWYNPSASALFAIHNDGSAYVGGESATYTTSDGTPNFVTALDANKLHVQGSVQLNGKNNALSIYAADAGNTAINEATFLAVNELGFSGGGGFYMNDTTYVRIRGNKTLTSTQDIIAPRFVDADDNNYYADPHGASVFSTLGLDSDLFHNGDTNTKLSFGTDEITLSTAGTVRLTANTTQLASTLDVYAPRYYDSNNSAYYVDPAGDSQLNTVDIDDYIRHRGDTNTFFGFQANDTFRIWTNNTLRFNIDNDSADFSVNVYAPRYYDSDNNAYYADPAGTSVFQNLTLNNTGGDTVLKFGPGAANSDDAHIEWTGGDNAGVLRFSTSDDNGTEYMEFGDYDNVDRGGAFTQWSTLARNYFLHNTEIRAPIFRDSNDPTNYYTNQAGTSVHNIQRVNQLQIDGSTYIVDSPSGEYGSIQVGGAKGGWAGYAINDDWVFMANGTTNMGLYNDTRNEWALYAQDNNFTRLYANGVHQIGAENGRGYAPTRMDSPIFYDNDDTNYFGDFASRSRMQTLSLGNQGDLSANNTYALRIWHNNRYAIGIRNSGADANYPWLFHDNKDGISAFGVHFNAVGDVFWVKEDGDAQFTGEVAAGNFLLGGGNEYISLNPQYGSGKADQTLFDGTGYWESRVIQTMQGSENPATTSTAEYVKNENGPFASTYALRTSAYRTFDSDFIPVQGGEEIYGELPVRYISGSGGLVYMGIRRYDKDKKPIAGNDGITYFVVGGNNYTGTGWNLFTGHTTIPTSHTPYNGSDGGACKYIRVIVLMNYNTGGALREYGPPIIKRTNMHSNVRTDAAMYSPVYYDSNDTNFYLDPASTSKLNTVDASNFRDRDNTAYFMNPLSGGKVAGTWDWTNGTINNLNNLTFNDPGPSEGILWKGGNLWQLYESPDDLSTNSGGNLQITSGTGNGTMRMRVDINGDVWAGRYFRASRFYDSDDANYYADPNGTSIFAAQVLRTGGLKMERNYNDNSIWFAGGADTNHVLWNNYFGGPTTRGAAASGGFDGMLWNTYQGLRVRGGLGGIYDIARFSTDGGGNGNGHYVQLYAANVEQLGTRGGYGYAPNQMRSPIYYDSNDTAYYGDFASTSRMNAILTNTLEFDNGWDIYDDDAENLSIRSNNGDHGTITFRDSAGADCGRIYFDNDNHWGFKSPDDEWQIYLERNARTILYYNGGQQARTQNGYFEANNQLRTPIFYDSNDTAFYADPNATSRFRDLTTLNVINSPGISGYSNALVSRDNRIISPSEDFSGQLKFGFTAWNNNNAGPWADYLHLRSYTDASGGDDNLVSFLKGGFGMRIWQQSWNSTTAYATYRNVALYNTNYGGGNDLYASIFYDANDTTFRVDPTGRSVIKHLEVASEDAGAADYWRAAIEVREYNYGGAQTDEWRIAPRIGLHWGGRVASQIALSSNGWVNILNNPGNAFENFRAQDIYANGTSYARRFTDLDNTGYYLDPASSSNLNQDLRTNEFYARGWFRNDNASTGLYNQATAMHWYSTGSNNYRIYSTANTVEIQMTTSGNNMRGYIYANNSNDIGFLRENGNWIFRTRQTYAELYGDLYAAIFYDRDNTAYYSNPASTSRFNNIMTNYVTNDGSVSSDDGFGIYWDSGRSTAYAIYREPGGWSFPYPDLRIAFHTGIKMGANASYQGMRFYNDYDMSGQVMSINNANDPLGGNNVYVNNNLQAGSSLRAPIFYDSNDTGWYANPNSTNGSRFRGFDSIGMSYLGLSGQTRSSKEYYAARYRITGDSNYWTGAVGWGRIDMNTVADWGSGFFDTWSDPPNEPAGTSHWVGVQAYHYTNGSSRYGWQMAGGPIENLRFRSTWGGFRTWRTIPVLNVNDNNGGAMYANIYYDTDNTGYYCDPSSFSNFNTGVRATDIYARDWFRNDNAGEGMYNQSTGSHSYSRFGQYWAITGNNNNSSMSLQLRATYEGTMCRWLYGDRTWSGDLNAAGQWQLQTRHQDGYSPTLRFIESGNESWTGNIGNDAGKLEYHANRFYLEAGGNSALICQFRRNGSNVSYIDNGGLYVGTATSARWADLAERYSADAEYEPGTVMGIDLDGDAEITIWREGLPMVGVISTNPAVQMNDMGIKPGSKSKKAKMNPFIALKGRIPCKVSAADGEIKKGMWLIPDPNAVGKAMGVLYGTPGINTHDIIGIALSESKDGEVEVKV